jgi:hypothetical protein
MSVTRNERKDASVKQIIAAAKADVAETVGLYFAPVVAIVNMVTKAIQDDSKVSGTGSKRGT